MATTAAMRASIESRSSGWSMFVYSSCSAQLLSSEGDKCVFLFVLVLVFRHFLGRGSESPLLHLGVMEGNALRIRCCSTEVVFSWPLQIVARCFCLSPLLPQQIRAVDVKKTLWQKTPTLRP